MLLLLLLFIINQTEYDALKITNETSMHVSEERQEVTAAFLTKGSNGFQLDILISRMLLLWSAVYSDMLTE